MMLSVAQINKIFAEFYEKDSNEKNLEILPNGMINYDGSITVKSYPSIVLPFNKVTGHFQMENTGVTNLELCPRECDMVWASGNALLSLKGHPDKLTGPHRHIQLNYINDLPLLSLFKIKDIESVAFVPYESSQEVEQELSNILNRYLPLGPKGMPSCMLAMKRAGYESNAKL